MKKSLAILSGIFFFLLTASASAASVGQEASWQALAIDGAAGTVQKEDAHWVVNKTKHPGYLIARCSERPAVTSGKFYRISLEFQTDAGTIPGFLQVITLPAKRTPYPCSAMIYPIGKPRRVSCFLQMGQNESSLIINLVTKGHGKATILDAEVTEITEQEYRDGLAASAVKK